MSKFIVSGFQSVVRSIVFCSRHQIRLLMAAAGGSSDADVQDDSHEDDADDLHMLTDSNQCTEPNSDIEQPNGKVSETVTQSTESSMSDDDLPSLKWQSPVGVSSEVFVSEQEKGCSLSGMSFAEVQPKRQFHFSPWSNSETTQNTRQSVVSKEKGQQNGLCLCFCIGSVQLVCHHLFHFLSNHRWWLSEFV